jgi:hypothetical protein
MLPRPALAGSVRGSRARSPLQGSRDPRYRRTVDNSASRPVSGIEGTSLLGSFGARTRSTAEPTARGILATMVNDIARERAIYQALNAAGEVAAALQAHLIEEHKADPERAATQSTFTHSLKLLRQARERLAKDCEPSRPTISPGRTRSLCATNDPASGPGDMPVSGPSLRSRSLLARGQSPLALTSSLPMRQPMTLTFSAWGPFWPWVMSSSTFCPSSRLR